MVKTVARTVMAPNFVLVPRSPRRQLSGRVMPVLDSPTRDTAFISVEHTLILRSLEGYFAASPALKDDFEFLARSLGFFEVIDKDKTCLAVFRAITEKSLAGKMVSSSGLGRQLSISRGSVIHHVRTLLDRGLLTKKGRFYLLRGPTLSLTIATLREETDRALDRLGKTAERIDGKLSPTTGVH